MAHSSNLPCDGNGICMICKKKSAKDLRNSSSNSSSSVTNNPPFGDHVGQGSGWLATVLASSPVRTKIPVPITAPMSNHMRSHQVRDPPKRRLCVQHTPLLVWFGCRFNHVGFGYPRSPFCNTQGDKFRKLQRLKSGLEAQMIKWLAMFPANSRKSDVETISAFTELYFSGELLILIEDFLLQRRVLVCSNVFSESLSKSGSIVNIFLNEEEMTREIQNFSGLSHCIREMLRNSRKN
ncbi:hypothetical protein LOK49_LG05G01498 [Camellia lanceoleosa]|uniref:Uncharacterized protein n=1 Tax=Camellia lanceoleosa TaxID=1840588 RepID=A0ACC0HH73_9ERIC|nr:hypothetical protein LOK49_LG05G01498 [Camellia lanceoleosa]